MIKELPVPCMKHFMSLPSYPLGPLLTSGIAVATSFHIDVMWQHLRWIIPLISCLLPKGLFDNKMWHSLMCNLKMEGVDTDWDKTWPGGYMFPSSILWANNSEVLSLQGSSDYPRWIDRQLSIALINLITHLCIGFPASWVHSFRSLVLLVH